MVESFMPRSGWHSVLEMKQNLIISSFGTPFDVSGATALLTSSLVNKDSSTPSMCPVDPRAEQSPLVPLRKAWMDLQEELL
jgi:hypothetical protein